MAFKDHFSQVAGAYSVFRPDYPPALFDFLAELCPTRRLAWDCATGNGQAALALADRFERVIATDASAEQIENGKPHPNVEYLVRPAEDSGLEPDSIDLITVAQAAHWFDFDRFYEEVRRVTKPDGVLALWCYPLMEIEPAVDAVVLRLYDGIVGDYWPPERHYVDDLYGTLPFPFKELDAPVFQCTAQWRLETLLGYLGTWSGVARYRQHRNVDPVEEIEKDLRRAWGDTSEKQVHWRIVSRVARVHGS